MRLGKKTSNLFRFGATAARSGWTPSRADRRDRRRPRRAHRRGAGHDHLRGPGRRHPRARADAARGPAAQDDHARRRRHRAGHRVDLVPARAAARVGARDGRADRRRRGRHASPGRRARRPVPRLPQLLRHPRLRAAPGDRAAPVAPVRPAGAPARRTRPTCAEAITDVCDWPETRPTSSTAPCSAAASSTSRSAGSPTTPAARVAPATTPASRSSTARIARADRRPPHRARLHLALGHRLVLVLARAGRAAPGRCAGCGRGATAAPTSTAASSRWTGGTGLSGRVRRLARQAAGGAGHPGRRDPGRAARRVPRRVPPDVGITPVWLCPLRLRSERTWPLYPMRPGELYVNVGFWSAVRRAALVRHPTAHNRRDRASWSPTWAATSRCTRRSTTARASSGSTTTGPPTGR